ncbi:hypothetical protein SNOG_01903 [Parastagonospora nodorum SN15]|uniref:Uncharacterized protein n=1 Tax=Phaeosphaeria nodorum (strain SN15 / ATCC MYA-4574 / FGSC 10173) TaxID=321614 RepID=Q0V261_PHANO|nr:hypothetical protein SNOG_01903 [Parastagonospora nodorum SN15]EAT90115.1 hypothetical protein SNOG_01903 [Parastagonospora nodorum SN15]
MASMGVATLDMVEEEEEEGVFDDRRDDRRLSGGVPSGEWRRGEAPPRPATLASEGDEGEVTAVTGGVGEEGGGSREIRHLHRSKGHAIKGSLQ